MTPASGQYVQPVITFAISVMSVCEYVGIGLLLASSNSVPSLFNSQSPIEKSCMISRA